MDILRTIIPQSASDRLSYVQRKYIEGEIDLDTYNSECRDLDRDTHDDTIDMLDTRLSDAQRDFSTGTITPNAYYWTRFKLLNDAADAADKALRLIGGTPDLPWKQPRLNIPDAHKHELLDNMIAMITARLADLHHAFLMEEIDLETYYSMRLNTFTYARRAAADLDPNREAPP